MCEFLDQLDSIPAAPATSSVADWKARLQAVTTNEQLVTAVLELEGDINSLGSGLPSGRLLSLFRFSAKTMVDSVALAKTGDFSQRWLPGIKPAGTLKMLI